MPKYKEEQEIRYGRYKGARLGIRSIERIVLTIRKRQL